MLLMLTIVLLVLLAVGIFSLPIGSDDDDSSFYLHDRIMFKRKQLLVEFLMLLATSFLVHSHQMFVKLPQ
ncbi:hypothetical protein Hanom_Chr13g01208741 [Helianthus anomalus]